MTITDQAEPVAAESGERKRPLFGFAIVVVTLACAPLLALAFYALLKGPYAMATYLMGFSDGAGNVLAKVAACLLTVVVVVFAFEFGARQFPEEEAEAGEVE